MKVGDGIGASEPLMVSGKGRNLRVSLRLIAFGGRAGAADRSPGRDGLAKEASEKNENEG